MQGTHVGHDDSGQHSCMVYMKIKKVNPNSYHIAK